MKPDSVGIKVPNFDSFFLRTGSIIGCVKLWDSWLKRSVWKLEKYFSQALNGMYFRQLRAFKPLAFLLYSSKAFWYLNITLFD